jgi:NAD(P)-dependent dehydrogenase (short-subunit alcohol dehydrogenase family)
MGRLSGKKAVITGGTRGIGLAIAKAYAMEGASVVVSSRSSDSLGIALDEMGKFRLQIAGIQADVANLDDVKKLLGFTLEQLGGLDIWVNNAGIAGPYGPTWALEVETFEHVLRTNILGVYHGSVVAMQYFLNQEHGKLINMLGAGARRPAIFQTAYGSSKAWVRSFTKTLAEESKEKNVGVFAYSPGLVLTDLVIKVEVISGYEERLERFPMILRMWANQPDKVTDKVVWLASSETDGKTGLEIYGLSNLKMISGALREGMYKLTGRKREPIELEIDSIPPANLSPND